MDKELGQGSKGDTVISWQNKISIFELYIFKNNSSPHRIVFQLERLTGTTTVVTLNR